jgi:hypothetical protein
MRNCRPRWQEESQESTKSKGPRVPDALGLRAVTIAVVKGSGSPHLMPTEEL